MKDYFRYIMKKKGLNSFILAEHLKISTRHFNRLLCQKGFDLNQILKLLNIFDMTFEELFKKD